MKKWINLDKKKTLMTPNSTNLANTLPTKHVIDMWMSELVEGFSFHHQKSALSMLFLMYHFLGLRHYLHVLIAYIHLITIRQTWSINRTKHTAFSKLTHYLFAT